jgi:hypothetical protein
VENCNCAPRKAILCLGGDTTQSGNHGDRSIPDESGGGEESAPMPPTHVLPAYYDPNIDLSTSRVFLLGFEFVQFDDLSSERYGRRVRMLEGNNYIHDFRHFERKGWVTVQFEGKGKMRYYKPH